MEIIRQRRRSWVILGTIGLALAFPLLYSLLQSVIVTMGAEIIIFVSSSGEEAWNTYMHNLAFLNLLPGTVMLVLVGIYYYSTRHTALNPRLQFNLRLSPDKIFWSLLCGVALFCVIVLVFALIPWPNELQEEYAENMGALKSSPVVLMLLFEIVMAPVIEEVVYRAGFFYNLRKVMPLWLSFVCQAVLFGFIHLNLEQKYLNIQQGLYAILMGLILAYIYHITQSLTASILVHMVFNASNYFMLGILGVVASLSYYLALVGSVALALFCIKRLQPRYLSEYDFSKP